MRRNLFLLGGVLILAGTAVLGPAAAQPELSRQPGPVTAPPPAARKPADARAYVTLMVPEGAEVWFEGKKTTATGIVREFRSPPLDPGYQYSYDVRVRWRQKGEDMTQTRQVIVTAGADVVLDFLQPPPPAPPLQEGMPIQTTPLMPVRPAPIR
jgi:uncharacterized protein (TIGR03000 family)